MLINSGNAAVSKHVEDDVEPPAELESLAKGDSTVKVPKKMKATVQIGYDETMKNKLKEIGQTMEEFVTPVMAHIQAIYSDPSFVTNLILEVRSCSSTYVIMRQIG